jgi:hypothetical protein
MIPDTFKTIPACPAPIGSSVHVDFKEVTSSIGPRIRVFTTAPVNEGWFIQCNTSDPEKPGDWFTVPGSARLETLVYYDAGFPKPGASTRWWRAIRKS